LTFELVTVKPNTHCTIPRRDGQAEWACMNAGMVVTNPSTNWARRMQNQPPVFCAALLNFDHSLFTIDTRLIHSAGVCACVCSRLFPAAVCVSTMASIPAGKV